MAIGHAHGDRGARAGIAALLVTLLPLAAHGDNLLDAYALARQNDPRFRAAQAEGQATQTTLDQARAGMLPTARMAFELTDTRQRVVSSSNPAFAAGVNTFPTRNSTLSLTQPIFRKEVIERLEQARAVVRQSELLLLAAEHDLMLRTTSAYLQVLAANDALALARAEREAVGKVQDLVTERVKAGLGSVANRHDAAARHAATQANEIEAQIRLRDARQALREIIGRTIENPRTLRDGFSLLAPEPADIERWLRSALDQNLGLRARGVGVEVARLEVERQRAGHYPSLDLVLSRNRRDAGSTLFGGGSDVETTEAAFRLNIPIYEGGMTSTVTKEAVFRHQKAQEEFEAERRAVERATRAAYDGTVGGIGIIDALKQSVIARHGAADARAESYKSGQPDVVPVLDALRDLFLARRSHAQACYDYLLSRLRLKQLAGTLAESDLLDVDSALR